MTNMRFMILLIAIISFLLMGCQAEGVEIESAPLTAVMVEPLTKDVVEKHYMSVGEVQPNKQIDLMVSGDVLKIYGTIGEAVEMGMPLIELDSDNLATTYDTTKSQLQTVRNNLWSQYKESADAYEKDLTLYEAGTLTASALEQSKYRKERLYRQYADANTNYENQLSQLEESIEEQLIVSPLKGVIADILVEEGESYGNTLGVSIIDMSSFTVSTYVSSDMKRLIQRQDQVVLYPDGHTHEGYEGWIETIAELPNPSNKLFEVIIKTTSDYDYILGEYVEVEYTLASYEAYLAPTQSLIRQDNQVFVYVYENDRVRKTPVDVGLSHDDRIEVRGLDSKALILVEGQQIVSDGDEVKVIETWD